MLFLRLISFVIRGFLSCPYLPRLIVILAGLYSLGYVIKCIKEIGKQ